MKMIEVIGTSAKRVTRATALTGLLLGALTWSLPAQENGHDHQSHHDHADHEDPGHDEPAGHAEEDGHDAHAGDAHDDHAGHDHGSEGAALTLSAEEMKNAGLAVAAAGPGELRSEVRLPGEIVVNEDNVVHVVPLVNGIAVQVTATVGDVVSAGETLAMLDSGELGESKLDYLTKVNEILCCQTLLPRARAVHDDTLRLIAFLDSNPSLADLRSFETGEPGENLGKLMGTYTEWVAARRTYEREKGLFGKQIASEQEYLQAKAAYEKAAGEYASVRDSVAFEVKQHLLETEARLRAAEFEANTARQRLRLMGIGESDMAALDALISSPETCTDPACTECPKGLTDDEKKEYFRTAFPKYPIEAPISGTIIARHISRGENVGPDGEIFTIADLGTVWVNLAIHLRDLDAVRIAQEVTIRSEHSGRQTRGWISMISPVVDDRTRTALARVVLDNRDGHWPPGSFVVGAVDLAAGDVAVVVPKRAIQMVEGERVVFVPSGEGFTTAPVRLGRSDRDNVEVLAGLKPGSPYVAAGAFALKAKLVTSNLDPHAGHGH